MLKLDKYLASCVMKLTFSTSTGFRNYMNTATYLYTLLREAFYDPIIGASL